MLSGEKQRIERSYDFVQVLTRACTTCVCIGAGYDGAAAFNAQRCAPHASPLSTPCPPAWPPAPPPQVCSWFAARCDLILLLFDPAKLDISDEFKNVIQTLRGHDEKVRCAAAA